MAMLVETVVLASLDNNGALMLARTAKRGASRWGDRVDSCSTVEGNRPAPLTSDFTALPCLPVIDHPTQASPINCRPRQVCFASVRIKQYERILGDHPSCSAGAPIAIGWTVLHDESVEIEEYEQQRTLYRKMSIPKLILRREERESILAEWGVTNREMVASIRRNAKVKRQRRRTAQSCYDGLEEALEKASRQIKYGLMQSVSFRRSPKFSDDNLSNQYIVPGRFSERSSETSDSDTASLATGMRNVSNQKQSEPNHPNELRHVSHNLTDLFLSTASERLHPSLKKSDCSAMNASPPKRVLRSEPSTSSFSNNEMTELSSRTSGDISQDATFPRNSIGNYCEWEGTESSATSIVDCDFGSEEFSDNTL